MVKIYFKNYSSGSYVDWTPYLIEPPLISKKVESDLDGEAGVISFDSAKVRFLEENNNAVQTAFNTDLTGVIRYLFKIEAAKSDGAFVQVFEGMADFSTISRPNNKNEISFSVVDKLSAIKLVNEESSRLLTQLDNDLQDNTRFIITEKSDYFIGLKKWINWGTGNDEVVTFSASGVGLIPGAIWCSKNPSTGEAEYGLIKKVKWSTRTGGEPEETHDILEIYFYNDISGITEWTDEFYFYHALFNAHNIGITEDDGGDDLLTSFDAVTIIKALVNKQWSGVELINRTGAFTYPIPLSYWIELINTQPFGEHPYDALVFLANSIQCYVYFDRNGKLVLQSKSTLDTGGASKTLGTTKKISGSDNYFWDKLIDGVEVIVHSWIKNEHGEPITGTATLTKTNGLKTRNKIEIEVITNDSGLTTQAELDSFAGDVASDIMDFYGKRHESVNLSLHLDDNTIEWDLLDNINYNSKDYFFTTLTTDLIERTIEIELVSVDTYDYDLRSINIPESVSNSGSSFSSNISSPNGAASSMNIILTALSQLDTATGIVIQSGSAAFVKREITGTANRVDVTNGKGIGGNINIDIPDIYIHPAGDYTINSLTAAALVTTAKIELIDSSPVIKLSNSETGNANAGSIDFIDDNDQEFGDGNTKGFRLKYDASADKIQLQSDDTGTVASRLTVTKSGLVGIGTDSPGNLLSLLSSEPVIKLSNSETGNANAGSIDFIDDNDQEFGDGNTKGFRLKYDASADKIQLQSDDTGTVASRLTVTKSGLVGIGTDSPNRALALVSSEPVFSISNLTANQSLGAAIDLLETALSKFDEPGGFGFRLNYNASSNYFEIKSSESGVVQTNFRMSRDGKIAVGSHSPSEKLDVSGNLKVSGDVYIGGNLNQVNEVELNVQDRIINLNHGGDDATADSGGIILKGTSGSDLASILYQSNEWVFDTPINSSVGTNKLSDIEQSGAAKIFNSFSSGFFGTGFQLDYNVSNPSESSIEADNMLIRGTLKVYELLIQQIRATNGSVIVSSSAKVKSINGSDITFEDPSGNNICPFAVDDIILSQRVKVGGSGDTGSDIIKRIVRNVTAVNGSTATITTLGDAPSDTGSILNGDEFVRIGNTSNNNRQGVLYLTSDEDNSPFMDIIDGVASWSDWKNKSKVKSRFGNLKGITDDVYGSPQGYGSYVQNFYASGNVNISGSITAGDSKGIAKSFYAGRLNKNLLKYSNDFTQVWFTKNGASVNSGAVSPTGTADACTILASISHSNSGISQSVDVSSFSSGDKFTGSAWVKSASGNIILKTIIVMYGGAQGTNLDSKPITIDTDWQRINFTSELDFSDRTTIELQFLSAEPSNAFLIYSAQLEQSEYLTTYQENGSSLHNGDEFGMWAIKGGFAGTPADPAAAITDQGLVIRKSGAAAVWQGNDTISLGVNGSEWGLIGNNAGNNIFQLGSTNQIAGWNFDTEKLSKSDVRLESSAALKGLAIQKGSIDRVKIGDFNYSSMPDILSDSTYSLIGFTGIDSNDIGAGGWHVAAYPTFDAPTLSYVSISQVPSLLCTFQGSTHDGFAYRLIHEIDNYSKLIGRESFIEFKATFKDYVQEYLDKGGEFIVYAKYYDHGSNLIYKHEIFRQTIPDGGYPAETTIDKTDSNRVGFTLPVMDSLDSVIIEFAFINEGSQSVESFKPLDMIIQKFKFRTYESISTYITHNAFEVYNSPESYFKFVGDLFSINCPDLKVNGYRVVRWLGHHVTEPVQGVVPGDEFYDTTAEKFKKCKEIDSLGDPVWIALN